MVGSRVRGGFVVVVDDDPSVRRALSRLLKACDVGVLTYGSAEEFLEARNGFEIACLVVDVQMGGMSGLDLLDHVAETNGAMPTIVITAFDDAAIRARVLQRGAAFLLKPIESATLLATLGPLIGRDLDTSGT